MSEHTCRTCLHRHVSAARRPCVGCSGHAQWTPNPYQAKPAPAHACACDAVRAECDALRKQLSDARTALARTRLAYSLSHPELIQLGLNELSKALADQTLSDMADRAAEKLDLSLDPT